MSLQGVLSDFGVADVFQLIAQQRKTGVLAIESDERTLEVFFLDGQVVRARPAESRPDGELANFLLRSGVLAEADLADAWRQQQETLERLPDILVSERLVKKVELEQVARLLSDETIFELFLWDEGSFAFRPAPVSEQVGDQLVAAEMVLLDALRMRDEWTEFRSALPDLSMVLAQGVDVEVYRERRAGLESSTGMGGEALDRLFTRCDGRLTARRVVDLSRLGTFQAFRGLVAMLREGLLQVVHAQQAKAARPSRPIAEPHHWRRGTWVLVATGLLAAVLFALPGPSPRSYPLPVQALGDARVAATTHRVRMALEAHRWRTGAYPGSLKALSRPRGGFLAPVPADRYLYFRSEGGYSLIEK